LEYQHDVEILKNKSNRWFYCQSQFCFLCFIFSFFYFVMSHVQIYHSILETPEQIQSKTVLLHQLQQVIEQACHELYRPPKIVNASHPQNNTSLKIWFKPFGSFACGISTVGSDIDVCMFSTHSRAFIFDVLGPKLVEYLVVHDSLSTVYVISDSKMAVPILKIKFQQVEFDVSYCSLKQSFENDIFPTDVKDVISYVHSSSFQDVSSLCGVVVGAGMQEAIMNLGEKSKRIIVCVKHWAKTQGVYSNKLGFLGGVSWCILVLYFCKMLQYFPCTHPSFQDMFASKYSFDELTLKERIWDIITLDDSIQLFFMFCKHFDWQHDSIYLHYSPANREQEVAIVQKVKSVNKPCFMYIYTDVYQPHHGWTLWNSTYNVFQSSYDCLHQAWSHALERLQVSSDIDNRMSIYDELEPTYQEGNYLFIQVCCKQKPSYLFKLEAKIKQLFVLLESVPNLFIYPCSRRLQVQNHVFEYWLKFQTKQTSIDLTEPIAKFKKDMFDGFEHILQLDFHIKYVSNIVV